MTTSSLNPTSTVDDIRTKLATFMIFRPPPPPSAALTGTDLAATYGGAPAPLRRERESGCGGKSGRGGGRARLGKW